MVDAEERKAAAEQGKIRGGVLLLSEGRWVAAE